MRRPSEPRVFVGRERELAQLSSALAAARGGRGSLCLLVGERGVGKTTLAEQLCTAARDDGIPVARGPCWDAGGAPAYWPWIGVLRALARDLPAGEKPLSLGRGGADVVALVPELAGRVVVGAVGPAPARDPEQRRFELFDAVVAYLTTAAAATGAVIVLEDLHAADEGSLLLLSFLARQLHGASLLVLATQVDVDVSPPPAVATLLDGVARDARRLWLAGLGDADVAALIAARTGRSADPQLLAAVQRTTAGNAFFVDEIVRVLAADARSSPAELSAERLPLPDSVRSALSRRLDPLEPATRALLESAAVIGAQFELRRLAACARIEPAVALARLEPAERLNVVRALPESPGRYVFAHALVRETLLRGLTPAARSLLHESVVKAIELQHEGTLDDHLPALAYHSSAALPAGSAGRAAAYAGRAGDRAARQLAYEEAARYYEQALSVLGTAPAGAADRCMRCELLLSLGSARRRAGAIADARVSFQAAAGLARELAEPRLLAQAALGYGGTLGGPGIAAGSDEIVVALLEEALEALGPQPTAERAQLLARLALELYYTPEVQRRLELSEEAVRTAAQTGDTRSRLIALYSRNWSTLGPDHHEQRRRAADELLDLAAGSEDLEMRFSAHHFRLANYLERGDLAGVEAELGACARIAETLRQPFYEWQLGLLRAMRALLQGRAQESERFALEAFEAGRVVDEETAAHLLAAQLFNHRWIVGRLGELAGAIDDYADKRHWIPSWHCAAAFLRSEIGQPQAARERLDAVGGARFTDLPRDGNWMIGIALAGLAASAVGATTHAAALYELAAPVADRVVVVAAGDTTTGPMALAAGALAGALGRWEVALGHFATADRVTARLDARALAALTHRERARMLVARGGDGDAQAAAEQCRSALALAQPLGMARLAEQAQELLAALPAAPGAPSRRMRVAVFERTGEAWRVGCEPDVTLLRDSKGMAQLATLLASPGLPFAAVDLAGNGDGAGGPDGAERARLNVTRALRGAIRRVAAHDPALGRELDDAVRTGAQACYEPPAGGGTRWRVSP